MYMVSTHAGNAEDEHPAEMELGEEVAWLEVDTHPEADAQRTEVRERVRDAIGLLNAADRELVEKSGIRGERIRRRVLERRFACRAAGDLVTLCAVSITGRGRRRRSSG